MEKINVSIGQDPHSKSIIGVLDIYGFESFKFNRWIMAFTSPKSYKTKKSISYNSGCTLQLCEKIDAHFCIEMAILGNPFVVVFHLSRCIWWNFLGWYPGFRGRLFLLHLFDHWIGNMEDAFSCSSRTSSISWWEFKGCSQLEWSGQWSPDFRPIIYSFQNWYYGSKQID